MKPFTSIQDVVKVLIIAAIILAFKPAFAFQTADTVTLSLGWYPQFQFAGFYTAFHKGYYEELGLHVIIKTHDENKSSVEAVLSSTAQYGVGTGSMLLGHRSVDSLVVLAAIQQQSPVVLVSLDNNRFEKLSDFEGGFVHGGTEIRAMFLSAGVELDSLGSPFDIPEIVGVENGKYDGMTMYITDLPILKKISSYEFKIFEPSDYGINFYGECLFTSLAEANSHPDRVDNIIEATKKGWEYALKNKDEVAEFLVQDYGSSFSKEELLEEASIVEESLLIPSLYEIGSMQKNKWAEMSKVLSTLGIVKIPINIETFVYEKKEPAWGPLVRNSLIILSIITSFLIVSAVVLITFNVRLRKEVNKRTDELKNALEKLNFSLEKEKHITDNLEKIVKERTGIIEEQNIKLEEANTELENRVKERTKNLQITNKELDMFIYSMSHDIRAPLASIQGLINVIDIYPDKKDEYLKLISQNVSKLDVFIEEILEYTRNTKRTLNNEVFELKPLVLSIFDQLKYIPGHDRITPLVEIKDDFQIVSDKTRLLVVLRNLISNAIKYQDVQKSEMFIKVKAESNNGKVSITIEDNGIGISEEHLEKVYDMFYRATENSKGSGLGLFIVKEILTNMHGTVKVESVLNKGTIFRLELVQQPIPEIV